MRPRHAIIHERSGHALAILVEERPSDQRLAHASRNPAMDLAFDDHGIDDRAEIVDGSPSHDLAFASLGVNFDLADVTAGREGEIRWIVEGALLETWLTTLPSA